MITDISVTQDNHSGASLLIAVHNPVVFIATVLHDNSPRPDALNVEIKDISLNVLATYRCTPYDDPDFTTRRFIFIADEPLRRFLESYEDVLQTNNTIALQDYLTKYFTLSFTDPDVLNSVSPATCNIVAIHASRQFGSDCNALDLYSNDSKHYVGLYGYPVYFYSFVDFPLTNLLEIYIDNVKVNDILATESYSVYRFSKNSLSVGNHIVNFYIAGEDYGSHTVEIKPDCNSRLIKYLDKNGEYRFYPFNKYFTERANPQILGKTNELITSLLTSQGNQNIVGYKNNHILHLVADGVSQIELDNLKDLWTSPKVYLYIGTGLNELSDWLKVEVQSGDNPVKWGKNNFSTVEFDCILPENFSITLL